METINTIEEPVKAEESAKQEQVAAPKENAWQKAKSKISYQMLVNNTPFIIFVALLCILYIANNNKAISLTKAINDQSKILKELKWKQLDMQSKLMYQTTESRLLEKTEKIGLQSLDRPAYEIKETFYIKK